MTKTDAWPDDDIAILRRAVDDGCTANEASARLDGRYSRNACIGKALRLGLNFHSGQRGPKPANPASQMSKEAYGLAVRQAAAKRKAMAVKPHHPVQRRRRVKVDADLVEPVPIGPKNDVPSSSFACRAIKGDVMRGDWQYCGHRPKDDNSQRPYCPYHSARFFTGTAPKPRDPAPFYNPRKGSAAI